ncbi:hypothetical protein GBAR_LOCUS17450, partial [Geodia barretti]
FCARTRQPLNSHQTLFFWVWARDYATVLSTSVLRHYPLHACVPPRTRLRSAYYKVICCRRLLPRLDSTFNSYLCILSFIMSKKER